MYGTAPVIIAALLRPASKGVLGWTGNIPNTCRSLTYAVFNIPALVLNSFEQEYVNMTTSDNYHAAALLIDASRDLAFISDILASSPEIITDHRWAVNIILNTAIKDVGKACTLIKEMPG